MGGFKNFLGGVFLFILTMVLSIAYNGWVLSVVWGWFITPVFEWMPSLTIIQAVGLSLVVGFLTKQVQYNKDATSIEGRTFNYMMLFLAPTMALIFGYIIQLFM